MDLNSRLFDRIRIKPRRAAEAPAPTSTTRCEFPGCSNEGVFRAPKGRDREGEYFCFCMEHVREYNATYDYFRGMDDESLAKFRQAEVIGHRPTWKMGPRRPDGQPPAPRYNMLALKALFVLDLDANATEAGIKARYKELVKRHHPDANGGDRSSEDKLREIIQAYNYLRANKLV